MSIRRMRRFIRLFLQQVSYVCGLKAARCMAMQRGQTACPLDRNDQRQFAVWIAFENESRLSLRRVTKSLTTAQ